MSPKQPAPPQGFIMKVLVLLALLPSLSSAKDACFPKAFSADVANLIRGQRAKASVDFSRSMVSLRSEDFSVLVDFSQDPPTVYHTDADGNCLSFQGTEGRLFTWDRCLDGDMKSGELSVGLLGVPGERSKRAALARRRHWQARSDRDDELRRAILFKRSPRRHLARKAHLSDAAAERFKRRTQMITRPKKTNQAKTTSAPTPQKASPQTTNQPPIPQGASPQTTHQAPTPQKASPQTTNQAPTPQKAPPQATNQAPIPLGASPQATNEDASLQLSKYDLTGPFGAKASLIAREMSSGEVLPVLKRRQLGDKVLVHLFFNHSLKVDPADFQLPASCPRGSPWLFMQIRADMIGA